VRTCRSRDNSPSYVEKLGAGTMIGEVERLLDEGIERLKKARRRM
jgi:hypothetical protein